MKIKLTEQQQSLVVNEWMSSIKRELIPAVSVKNGRVRCGFVWSVDGQSSDEKVFSLLEIVKDHLRFNGPNYEDVEAMEAHFLQCASECRGALTKSDKTTE